MNTNDKGVLAWLDSLHETTADGALTNHKWPAAQEARAAVAELVEAAASLRNRAKITVLKADEPNPVRRLDAALARVQGGAK